MRDEHLIKEPMTDEELVERAELLGGLFKLLITLNSSAIGVIVIFSGNFLVDDTLSKILVAMAPVCFLASLVCSFMMVFSSTLRQSPRHSLEREWEQEEWWFFSISFVGFITGISCLFVIALNNFFRTLPQWIELALLLGMLVSLFYIIRWLIGQKQRLRF
ncbi:MAG: hypothetical protein AAGI37_07835 [Planctomycetota bacterium]